MIEKITLTSGAIVWLEDQHFSKCRSCAAPIKFAKTVNGKKMPIEEFLGEWRSHFATCPAANYHRKKLFNN